MNEEVSIKLNEIIESIKSIFNRQNSQYTDIMLQLKELRDVVNEKHLEPEDHRSDDELYEEAYKAVVSTGKASTSFIQRKLGIGYSRVAQLMDLLETKGIIGPAKGSKPREVIIEKL